MRVSFCAIGVLECVVFWVILVVIVCFLLALLFNVLLFFVVNAFGFRSGWKLVLDLVLVLISYWIYMIFWNMYPSISRFFGVFCGQTGRLLCVCPGFARVCFWSVFIVYERHLAGAIFFRRCGGLGAGALVSL